MRTGTIVINGVEVIYKVCRESHSETDEGILDFYSKSGSYLGELPWYSDGNPEIDPDWLAKSVQSVAEYGFLPGVATECGL